MAAKALIELLPGFYNDRDEDWMAFIGAEERFFLQKNRLDFIRLKESLDKYEEAFRREVSRNDSLTPKEKQEQVGLHALRKKKFQDRLEKKASKILEKVRGYKEEGIRRKREATEKEAENINSRRQMSAQYPDMVEIDGDYYEMVVDDYLPSYHLPKQDVDNTPRAPTPVQEPEPARSARKKKGSDNSFTRGASPNEAKVLLDLKSLIMKYDAREQVIQAIGSYKFRRDTMASLDTFSKLFNRRRK